MSSGDDRFDPEELVQWAETYGHPEEWAKRAQAVHARAEDVSAALVEVLRATEHLDVVPAALRGRAERALVAYVRVTRATH